MKTSYQYHKNKQNWIEKQLNTMTIEEKVGQMVFLTITSNFKNESSNEWQYIRNAIEKAKLGGLCISGRDIYSHAHIVNVLQRLSPIPLILCADFEHGVGERFQGATNFPTMMALGAAGDFDLTYQCSQVIAYESMVLGIPLILAPVADINTNPFNPTINIRSFGFVMGIELIPQEIRLVLLDFSTKLVFRHIFLIKIKKDFEIIVDHIVKISSNVLKEQNISIEKMLGLGIGIPGLIDSSNGIIHYSYTFNIKNVHFLNMLQPHFPFPVKIGNDANVGALGIKWMSRNE